MIHSINSSTQYIAPVEESLRSELNKREVQFQDSALGVGELEPVKFLEVFFARSAFGYTAKTQAFYNVFSRFLPSCLRKNRNGRDGDSCPRSVQALTGVTYLTSQVCFAV